ncbi:MAG: hypothetical protein RLY20_3436 [Verrucomicrobiota bacterium]|jgi:HEAT repeat protein
MTRFQRFSLLVFLLAVSCLTLQSCSTGGEPSYRGKKLSQWLLNSADAGEAEIAVRAMGTNAIPYLLRWLADTDSNHNLHAPNGFAILGETAAPAIPQLEQLLLGTNELAATLAASALGRIGRPAAPVLIGALTNANYRISTDAALRLQDLGTNALPAIPILLKQLESPRAKIRARATDTLGSMELEPATVVPALTRRLYDSSDPVRHLAVSALAEFGPAAKSAAPDLMMLLPAPNYSESVSNALLEIAPEALTNPPTQ